MCKIQLLPFCNFALSEVFELLSVTGLLTTPVVLAFSPMSSDIDDSQKSAPFLSGCWNPKCPERPPLASTLSFVDSLDSDA